MSSAAGAVVGASNMPARSPRRGGKGGGDGGVLALRVGHPCGSAERCLPEQERLDQGGLAEADLAGHEHVRVREKPGGVEGERVEGEGSTDQVPSDVDAWR